MISHARRSDLPPGTFWSIRFRISLLILSGFLSAYRAQCQVYTAQHVDAGRGLSQGMVSCIMQDHKGFLWIGTHDGLNRYDGYDFRVFRHDPSDSLSLQDSRITGLFEDRCQRIWVVTALGLDLFNPVRETFQRIPIPGNHAEEFFRISEDSYGVIWFTSRSGKVFRLYLPDCSDDLSNLDIRVSSTDPEGIPGINQTTLMFGQVVLQVSDSTYWVSNDSGMYIMTDLRHAGTQTFSTDLSQLPKETRKLLLLPEVKIILPSGDGQIWFCFADRLIRLDHLQPVKQYFMPPGAENDLLMIDHLPNGTLMGAGIQGISLYPPVGDPHFFKYQDLGIALIWGFPMVDAAGIYWVGTPGKGLYQLDFNAKRFAQSHSPDDQVLLTPGSSVRALHETSDGDILIGHSNNLVRVFHPNAQTYDSLELAQGVSSFCASGPDKIWALGTALSLIEKRDDGRWAVQKQYEVPGRASPNSATVIQAADSSLWIATVRNLCRFDIRLEQFTCIDYPVESNLSRRFYEHATMIQGTNGCLWIGTAGGLFRYDIVRDSFTMFQNIPSDPTSLALNTVRSIALDPISPDRYLWVGTAGRGLDRLDLETGQFRHFGEAQGLPDMVIYGILPDADRNLWISTNRGLCVLNTETELVRTFDESDGLQSNEFNALACAKSADGTMLFGGVNGFNRFRPESVIVTNHHIPQLAFTGLRISNKTINVRDEGYPGTENIAYARSLQIPPDIKSFSIEFSALDFAQPEKNQYAFRLEGFDKEWQSVRGARAATYTNLNPGTYTFRVRGSNNDGIWNEEGIAIQVVVLPPWYRTAWAFVLYAVLLGAIVYFLRKKDLQEQKLKYQLELEQVESDKLKEIAEVKSRFFANISHELRTPLTLIMGHLEGIGRKVKDAQVQQRIKTASKNGQQLLQLINQLLDLSRLEAQRMELRATRQDLIPFLRNIILSYESLAQERDIILNFQTNCDHLEFAFDSEKLEQVFMNLYSNAFKFSADGASISCHVNLRQPVSTEDTGAPASVEIQLTDTGLGIPEEQISRIFERFYRVERPDSQHIAGTGLGLALTRELVLLHQGTITVTSVPDAGTTFTITLPLEHGVSTSIPGTSVAPVEQAAFPEGERAHAHILVVEDHPEVSALLKDQLEDEGYVIFTASHGADGLEIAFREMPDLIISDIMMPVMDGIAFSQQIRADLRTSHIPLILLTAKTGEDDKIEGLKTGVDDYLTKPFSARELSVRVANLLSQRRLLRERFSNAAVIKPQEVSVVPMDQAFMQEVLACIDENLGESTFGVEVLADRMHLSVTSLQRKLQALVGRPPGQLIRTARLQRAAQLLSARAGNVNDVAYQVGYTVPENFSRSFKKEFGVTPSEYAHGLRSSTR